MLTLTQARQIVDECQNKLNVHFAVTIRFNHRLTRAIGRATYKTNLIELSYPLFQRASLDEQINTVVHEFCHLAKFYMYGGRESPHGYTWKVLHRRCGYEPRRTHNVDRTGLTRKEQSKYPVYCACLNPNMVTVTILKRMGRGVTYRCRRCKEILNKG